MAVGVVMGMRRKGFTLMEFLVVAGAAAILAAGSFGALRSLAANSRVEEARAVLTHVRNQINLFRTRWISQTFPSLVILQGGSYSYYAAQVWTTTYFYHNGAPPEDPFKHSATIWGVASTSQSAAITELGGNGGTGGWMFNATTGQFWINLNDAEYGTMPTIGQMVRLTGDPSTW